MIIISINQKKFWDLIKSRIGHIVVNMDQELDSDEMILVTESSCKIFCKITSVTRISELKINIRFKILGEQITN